MFPIVFAVVLVGGGIVEAAGPASAPASRPAFVPIEKVEANAPAALRVNGRPFFPLMGFYQSPKSFQNAKATGLNGYFYPGDKPAPKEYLDALKAEGLYGMVPFDASAIGHPALLAWLLPHEPDAAYLKGKEDMSPAAMLAAYERIKKADPSRPVVLDFSPAFTSIPEESNLPAGRKKELYPAYAKAADLLTYNVYPIWGFNRPDCIDWPARAADDLKALVGEDKPFLAMIETGKGARGIPEANQAEVSPEEIRAEVWMAICKGAKGIIYFTHQFQPKFNEFGPDAAKQAAIRKINGQIAELAPAILGPAARERITVVGEGGLAVHYTARTCPDSGQTCLFILNGDTNRRAGRVTVTVEGGGEGLIPIVEGEGRILKFAGESFTDEFAPLALHVYRLKPRK